MLATNRKLAIARALSTIVVGVRRGVGRSSRLTARRGGLTWQLDLKEGIDLSIYLLGGFELRVLRKYRDLVQPGDVVIDIGANIGAHTLPLSQLVGEAGRVIACEPTRYAFEKLIANVAANPGLRDRITTHQALLAATSDVALPEAIYSSWPLDADADLHAEHLGRLKATDGAVVTTLDDLVRRHGLSRVALVKIDVDGHECDVLRGGRHTLHTLGPVVVLELAPYVHEPGPGSFDEVLGLLWEAGYDLRELASGRALPRDPAAVRRRIPAQGGISAIGTRGG